MDNELISKVYRIINNTDVSLYLGGTRVDNVIDKPHDYDIIIFCDEKVVPTKIRKTLIKAGISSGNSKGKNQYKTSDNDYDFSQIRRVKYQEIDWFSYLDVLMQPIIGKDICPKTDIIYGHRKEFIDAMFEKAVKLKENRIKNKKRWYHILRGCYILKNNSYEVSDEQRREINTLHDLSDGWEEVAEKTWNIIKSMKEAQ